MRAFVTVGSTRFDALVQRILSDALVDVLRKKGYSTIVVQCGNSDFDTGQYIQEGDLWTHTIGGGGVVEVWRFKPSLQEEYEQADLVISHAGTPVLHPSIAVDLPRCKAPVLSSMSSAYGNL